MRPLLLRQLAYALRSARVVGALILGVEYSTCRTLLLKGRIYFVRREIELNVQP